MTLKNKRTALREKLSRIYQKPYVFITAKVAGILIAVVGIVICLGMIIGTYALHSTTKKHTKTIETTIYKYLDKGDDGLDTIQEKVDSLTPATDIVQEVSDITGENIDRLETLKLSLIAFNFGNKFDTPIERIEDTIEALKKFKELPELILESKEKVHDKIEELKDKIDETRTQVSDGGKQVRRITFYTFLVSFLLATIFFVGEYSLLTRCIPALRNYRRKRKDNYRSVSK